MTDLLVIGCGFLGAKVAGLCVKQGLSVIGVARNELKEKPFPVEICDITGRDAVENLFSKIGGAKSIIHCASSGRGGPEAYRNVYYEGTRHFLEIFKPAKFVFTGSTSVYAQTTGEWVTEESIAEPARETGKILRETEELVLANNGVVARLSGIYGPGRSVLLRKFLDGTAVIEGEGQRFINQIHRDDAARALGLLVQPEKASGIYNVSDDTPIPQVECYQWLADHFKKHLPPYGPLDLDRKRGWTNKRVSNQRMKSLGWECEFPSFRDFVKQAYPLG